MNIKKIIIGVLFILCSIMLALFAAKVKPANNEPVPKQVKEADKPVVDQKADNKKEGPREVIAPQKKVVVEYEGDKNTVKEIEPNQEQPVKPATGKKREKIKGYLWVDRKSSKYVVTLGKKNGLAEGDKLVVYQADVRLGTVEADSVYDTIAYVHLIDISSELSNDDYYRVVIE